MGRYLIINADDFGKTEEVNARILKALELGYINQTTLMVNMPFCDVAVREAKTKGYSDKIGLHLNLTEGVPLTSDILNFQTFCINGTFNGEIRNILRHRKLSREEKCVLKLEISAQISKFLSYNLPLKHLDSHHHIHTEYQLLKILFSMQVDVDSMRLYRNLLPLN